MFHCSLVSIALDIFVNFHSFVCKSFSIEDLRWLLFLIFYSIMWLVWAYFSFLVTWDTLSISYLFDSGKFLISISLNIASIFYSSGIFIRWIWVSQLVLHSENCCDHLKNLIVSGILGGFFTPFPTVTNSLFLSNLV